MATTTTTTTATPVTSRKNSSDDEDATKTFKDRLEDMPTYNITVSSLQHLYSAVKGIGYFTGALTTVEDVAATFTTAAKPVVMVATGIACKVVQPVVGEIKDPGASIDGCAAEILHKVQEKLPWLRQNPREYVEPVKTSAIDKAESVRSSAIDKVESVRTSTEKSAAYVQGMALAQKAVQQLDNAVAIGDLIVELLLPMDKSCEDDIAQLEEEVKEEERGVIEHANDVRRKAVRRGTRKLMSYGPVQTSVDIIVKTVNSYVKSVRDNVVVKDVGEKTVAVVFAYVLVPTQVVSNYLQWNRVVQWIIPNHLRSESVQVIENTNDTNEANK